MRVNDKVSQIFCFVLYFVVCSYLLESDNVHFGLNTFGNLWDYVEVMLICWACFSHSLAVHKPVSFAYDTKMKCDVIQSGKRATRSWKNYWIVLFSAVKNLTFGLRMTSWIVWLSSLIFVLWVYEMFSLNMFFFSNVVNLCSDSFTMYQSHLIYTWGYEAWGYSSPDNTQITCFVPCVGALVG